MGRSFRRNTASPNRPHYCHSTKIQTILPDRSISGNYTRGNNNTPRGMLNMVTERMELIDKEIMAINARKFGKSSIARTHFSKHYTHHWYTEERAHKFDDKIPATCRCCKWSEDETILHNLRCSSRKEVHTEHNDTFEQIMREIEAPNHHLHLFEAGIDLALLD